ncbi:MAG: zf-TFIIB domain-containing protein, partial [Myxococcales bacterium]|nr:zf-TFIIB domain-containing protein [Myxococcales bacterium]
MSNKHSEDSDIAELQEIARRRDAARQRYSQLSEPERARLKELHWMCCPKCGAQLTEVQFRQVKVDKCFFCGGVFLDD